MLWRLKLHCVGAGCMDGLGGVSHGANQSQEDTSRRAAILEPM